MRALVLVSCQLIGRSELFKVFERTDPRLAFVTDEPLPAKPVS